MRGTKRLSNRANRERSLEIPDKLYFKIGEVARLLDVKPYVLRYWETEFPTLVPPKSRGNQRLYRREDIERIGEVRDLLYRNKFTIDGARTYLSHKGRARVELPPEEPKPVSLPSIKPQSLLKIKARLLSLLRQVEGA